MTQDMRMEKNDTCGGNEALIRSQKSHRLLEKINAAYEDAPDEEEEALLRGMLRSQREVLKDEWQWS